MTGDMTAPKPYEQRVFHEADQRWHPWTVCAWLPPIGFWESAKYRLGLGRQDRWVQVFSADTEQEALDYIARGDAI